MRPTAITADRTRAIMTVTWEDGRAIEYPFKLLSDACPCATCSEERNNPDPLKVLRPRSYELESINPVGSYAVNITWKGGCRYGIYSYDYLLLLGARYLQTQNGTSQSPDTPAPQP